MGPQYNSLGWLKTADNPETGLISYGYDENGNVTSRSDGRGASVTLEYDRWNRLTRKSYAKGTAQTTPQVDYSYDAYVGTSYDSSAKGRLTQVAVSGGTTVRYDQYDALGRVLRSTQVTDNKSYPFVYTYNAAGGQESIQYSLSNRTVYTCYDDAGRVASVKKDSAAGTDVYAAVASGLDPESGVTVDGYSPFGGIQRLALQSGAMTQRWQYNERGQITGLGMYKTPSGGAIAPLMRLGPGYGMDASSNNGNVRSQTILLGSNAFTATQDYGYEKVNRLRTAQENNGSNWKQGFGYDRWGNRWIDQTLTSGIVVPSGTPTESSFYSTGKNRIGADSLYDQAGNGSPVPGRTYSYDVENRMVAVTGSSAELNETF